MCNEGNEETSKGGADIDGGAAGAHTRISCEGEESDYRENFGSVIVN